MASGTTLNESPLPDAWRARAESLLDTYLIRFGVTSAPARARWIERVIGDLATRADQVATEDLLEEAIEHLLALIERRLAAVCGRDPVRERRAVARTLVALLGERHRDLTNRLLERVADGDDTQTLERVRDACTASSPHPVPVEVPLAMPTQSIELRTLNPLRSLFGRSS